MFRLVPIAVLIAAGIACGPPTYSNSPFDTDPDQGTDDNNPDETAVDTSGGQQGGTSNGTGGKNNPPRAVAVADPSRDITPGTAVNLDATNSQDADGDPLAYHWELTQVPTGSGADIANPTFELASLYIDIPGTYKVLLTVTDGKLEDEASLQLVVVNPNKTPIANAGPDLTVDVGTVVQLSGAASTDPDGDTLSYYWDWITKPPGSVANLEGIAIPGAALSPSFVTDIAGTYTVKLEVEDGEFRSRADMVNVIARAAGGSGGVSSSGSSSSCDLGCAAQAAEVASDTWSAGDLAGGFGLLALPVFVALWQRRRDDEEA